MSFSHAPVMPAETIAALQIKPDGIYIDGTVGGGGHAAAIAARLTTGQLIGIDRDGAAIAAATERLSPYAGRCRLIRDNYTHLRDVLARLDIAAADGFLLDLGVSSHQLDTASRGFSYMQDARLDMRMDDRDTLTAYTVVNQYTPEALLKILYTYGEERFAGKIVKAIIKARQQQPIATTLQLSEIIRNALPKKVTAVGGHPAKKTFQAIRIEVNQELTEIDSVLREMAARLKPGGRIAVITFHSLEDRLVKHCFRSLAAPCTCPKDFPVCVCGKQPLLTVVTRKPMLPSEAEIAANHRSHSAKLRVGEAYGNPTANPAPQNG